MLNWLIWTLMIPVKGECPNKGRPNKKTDRSGKSRTTGKAGRNEENK